MRILVTFAVEPEFAPWRRLRDFRRTADSSVTAYQAEIPGGLVRVILTGVGVGQAQEAIRSAFDAPADLCISAGLAGGLEPAYRAGEILVARQVGRGTMPVIHCDEALLTAAADHGASVAKLFFTADTLIRTAAEKRRLSAFADVVEMESYTVLAAARERGVPGVAIRAISDPCDMDLPYDLERIADVRGRIQLLGLIAQVLRRPHRLPALVQLGRQSRRAAVGLAEFLDAFVGSLAAQISRYEFDSAVAAT